MEPKRDCCFIGKYEPATDVASWMLSRTPVDAPKKEIAFKAHASPPVEDQPKAQASGIQQHIYFIPKKSTSPETKEMLARFYENRKRHPIPVSYLRT